LIFLAALPVALGAGKQVESQTSPAPPVAARLSAVVLDPAHGGSDSGARGSGGIESEIVLDYGRAIRVALEARGLRVVLTREGNQSPSFDDRSAIINGLPDAVFVSLHVSSTGPVGTARAYFCAPPPPPAVTPTSSSSNSSTGQAVPPRRPSGLLNWDHAQEPYLESSRRLAELVQIQLAQKFEGSPETPSPAAIRQLRTIAAPAIAIEVSSIASEPTKLTQMGDPLGEALARALAAFQQGLQEGSIPPGPPH
jgi:N-acetylmuramoyl-L-alanine amidase